MMKKSLYIVLISIIVLQNVQLNAQDYPYEIGKLAFLRMDANRLVFPGDSSSFMPFFAKFRLLETQGKGQIRVLHIGDSHIQAGILPNRLRDRLQTFIYGGGAARGHVFPYRLAHTNTPIGFYSEYNGKWENCKNVESARSCNLGVSGITAWTSDSLVQFSIIERVGGAYDYEYSRAKVFCDYDTARYQLSLTSDRVLRKSFNDSLGYVEFEIEGRNDTISFELLQKDSLKGRFELYGISLETDDPGFIYDITGVNGADVRSLLRCNYLEQHIRALKPDLIIVSLGANDGYVAKFDSLYFYTNYDQLMMRLKKAAPDASFLLTIPGDNYYRRRYLNRNTLPVRNVIQGMAQKHNTAYWDFFTVMGGLNSIRLWQKYTLGNNDYLHYTYQGYMLQGDLLFNALMRSYDHYKERYYQKHYSQDQP